MSFKFSRPNDSSDGSTYFLRDLFMYDDVLTCGRFAFQRSTHAHPTHAGMADHACRPRVGLCATVHQAGPDARVKKVRAFAD